MNYSSLARVCQGSDDLEKARIFGYFILKIFLGLFKMPVFLWEIGWEIVGNVSVGGKPNLRDLDTRNIKKTLRKFERFLFGVGRGG